MEAIEDYRSLFPIALRCTFLNHAAVSSPSLRVAQAVKEFMEESSIEGISRYGAWMRRIEEVRSLFGRLIGSAPEEVAFVGNTSEGLSLVAGGIAWKENDVVLVPLPDFPTNIYPWLNLERLGVKVRFMEREADGRISPERVSKAVCAGTRLISVSSVDYSTGFLCDLEAIGDLCRRKGVLFCVDAIQSLGVVPMDVRRYGVHFLASGGHKWLLGPMGVGGLFVSREVTDMTVPVRVGWRSVVDENDFTNIRFELKENALRFEAGTMNLLGITGLGAAMELLLEVGIEKIGNRIIELNDYLAQQLSARGMKIISSLSPGERSGILSFLPECDPKLLFDFLLARKVMVSQRGAGIRIAPHFYNTFEDIDLLLKALDDFCGRRGA